MDAWICDSVNSILWTAYPWRWAQKALTAIAMVDGTQDFAIAAGNTTDFYKLLRVRIAQTDCTPDQFNDKITIRDWLPPDLTKSGMWGIQSAAWDPVGLKIRLERAMSVGTGNTFELQGEYWKNATKITDELMDAVFLFPDEYFPVFVDGVEWRLLKFIGDSRAGTIQTNRSGQRAYTGQLGVFMESLWNMMQSEDYGDEGSEYPDSPLGAREWGVGFYG